MNPKVELAIYAAAMHMLDQARYNIFANPDDGVVFEIERNKAATRLREILLAEQRDVEKKPTGNTTSGGPVTLPQLGRNRAEEEGK